AASMPACGPGSDGDAPFTHPFVIPAKAHQRRLYDVELRERALFWPPNRHSRESGNPWMAARRRLYRSLSVGSRFRGNDRVGVRLPKSQRLCAQVGRRARLPPIKRRTIMTSLSTRSASTLWILLLTAA